MTRANVLGIARDSYESMRLCVAAQDVVDCRWFLFPCVSKEGVPSVHGCRKDFLGLVGYEGTEQDAVLRQIDGFVVRVARRSILDMVRMGNKEELATMCYKKDMEGLPKAGCDQILYMHIGMHRKLGEDIDTRRGMLALEDGSEIKKSIQAKVDNAIVVFNDLRRTQLEVTFESLRIAAQGCPRPGTVYGVNDITDLAGDEYESSIKINLTNVEGRTSIAVGNSVVDCHLSGFLAASQTEHVDLAHLTLPVTQFTNSQVFKHDLLELCSTGTKEEAEKMRQVMMLHIASHAPVIGNLATGGFSRTPHDLAQQFDLRAVGLSSMPSRTPKSRQGLKLFSSRKTKSLTNTDPVQQDPELDSMTLSRWMTKLREPGQPCIFSDCVVENNAQANCAGRVDNVPDSTNTSAREYFLQFLAQNGVDPDGSIEFIRGGDTVVLIPNDMELLENEEGKLSNGLMEWFLIWLKPRISDVLDKVKLNTMHS